MTTAVVNAGSDDEPVDDLLARVATRHAAMLDEFRSVLDDMASDERASLAALSIAVRELTACAEAIRA